MPVKIRLQRGGRKGAPRYRIVIADARASRDGKFIAKIGTYNPTVQPSKVELDVAALFKWLDNGAQPTKIVRTLTSKIGLLYLRHLITGVKKGAISNSDAKAKYQQWEKAGAAKRAKKINTTCEINLDTLVPANATTSMTRTEKAAPKKTEKIPAQKEEKIVKEVEKKATSKKTKAVTQG